MSAIEVKSAAPEIAGGGCWVGAADMAAASAELQAGFVETDETRASEAHEEPGRK
jgi:hypothetical protein